jgi:carbonic anhydrase/acetyltransferase-like protein (isoleucine patch superfamily)
VVFGITLKRIRRISDGEVGGWIEKESNLSMFGNAWVSDNAWVYGDAWVYGNARVYGDARVSDNARVYGDARVSGDAWVSDNAWVYGDAWVSDNAWVYGDARVSGDAWVSGDARVYGDARVSGDAWVSDNAWVYGDAKVKKSPINIIGLPFNVTITETNMVIGCQIKTHAEWKAVTAKTAEAMGDSGARFYAHFHHTLLSMIDFHTKNK